VASPGRYRFLVVQESCLHPGMRARLAALLAGILDDGPSYLGSAWRTLPPAFRVVALAPDAAVAGQASGFWVPCVPATPVLGLGDVAVDPAHRRRQVARTLCRVATHEGRRRGARAVVAKTRPLRSVLGDLGYVAIDDFRFYYEDEGARACARHPDWMAATFGAVPARLRLVQGDF
jgi:GNAT superfamily N-acetyltransferase